MTVTFRTGRSKNGHVRLLLQELNTLQRMRDVAEALAAGEAQRRAAAATEPQRRRSRSN